MATTSKKSDWLVPAGLLLLTLVPMAAGGHRVAELAGNTEVTPDNARFFDMPAPVILHIFSASLFCVLGALQFAPALRRHRIGWHRAAGRITVPMGIIAALTGLWMTLFYDLPATDGATFGLLGSIRLLFGSAMAASLVLGFLAVRRRDITRHRAWMARGYAIGLGAGTQVFTHLPWLLFHNTPAGFTRAMLMAAGWIINLAVAEWAIRRRPRTSVPASATMPVRDSSRTS
jgi:uncharacterized membrane protein